MGDQTDVTVGAGDCGGKHFGWLRETDRCAAAAGEDDGCRAFVRRTGIGGGRERGERRGRYCAKRRTADYGSLCRPCANAGGDRESSNKVWGASAAAAGKGRGGRWSRVELPNGSFERGRTGRNCVLGVDAERVQQPAGRAGSSAPLEGD